MKNFGLLVVSLFLLMNVSRADEFIGVSDTARAEFNWTMHCRGCHQLDGTGNKGGTPSMVGIVSRFLHKKEGREYLSRVPGVAFVALPDNEVAELLNWMVQTFDKGNLPKGFVPYSEKEVTGLKRNPLISEASITREKILKNIDNKGYELNDE